MDDGDRRLQDGLLAAQVLFGGATGFLGVPPGLDGDPRTGIAGVTGIPRPAQWDVVSAAEAPDLTGDAVHFVALAGGDLLVDEDVPEGSLGPLADAVEHELRPPYRAEGIRHEEAVWAVAATQVDVVELPGLDTADSIEASSVDGVSSVTIDGASGARLPAGLAALTESLPGDWAIVASRVDGETWLVDKWRL
jgi:hypothetical protein